MTDARAQMDALMAAGDELLLSTETGVDGMEPVTQRYTR